ncbi:hypothetical protein K9F62_10410 [Desulfovibrio sp. JY]|nr:hypothetical protein K9F62_10410 [Desulfovibrio sp. JY]
MSATRPFDADGLIWPGILADIANAAGQLAAYRVAEAKGGTQTYFPRPERLTDDNWLVVACGWEAARVIARRCGGGKFEVPLGPLSGNKAAVARAIREGLAQGVSGQRVARLAGVDARTVRRHKNEYGAGNGRDDQYNLF